jgi:hypothetical protein
VIKFGLEAEGTSLRHFTAGLPNKFVSESEGNSKGQGNVISSYDKLDLFVAAVQT